MIKVIAICGLVAGLLVLVSGAGDENMLVRMLFELAITVLPTNILE